MAKLSGLSAVCLRLISIMAAAPGMPSRLRCLASPANKHLSVGFGRVCASEPLDPSCGWRRSWQGRLLWARQTRGILLPH